jgi:hypothetical protein
MRFENQFASSNLLVRGRPAQSVAAALHAPTRFPCLRSNTLTAIFQGDTDVRSVGWKLEALALLAQA